MGAVFILVIWNWIERLALKTGLIPADTAFAWEFGNPLFDLRMAMLVHMFFYFLDVAIPSTGKLEKRIGALERKR